MADRFKLRVRAATTAALLAFAGPALADGPAQPTPDVAAPPVPVRAAPLPVAEPAADTGATGVVALPGGDLTLNVPAGYRYYSADQAQAFLQRAGAAPPPGVVLGLIAPAGANIQAPDAWGAVLSYDAIGYVSAETASGLQSPTFEADVRTARASQNRAFEGFAMAPVFDPTISGVTWAERTAAPAAGGKDLRHEQRLLGRKGVAGLTSIGAADQMGAMAAAAPDMNSMLGFPEGQRYADFSPASDAISGFGVPQLVLGVTASNGVAPLAETAAAEGGAAKAGGIQGLFPWIALGVVGLAGVGYMVTRRKPDPNLSPDE